MKYKFVVWDACVFFSLPSHHSEATPNHPLLKHYFEQILRYNGFSGARDPRALSARPSAPEAQQPSVCFIKLTEGQRSPLPRISPCIRESGEESVKNEQAGGPYADDPGRVLGEGWCARSAEAELGRCSE